MDAARYRVWQFWRLLTQRIAPQEQAQVQRWLTPALYNVFCRLNLAEQHHAYNVRRTLVESGQTNPDLLTAGLLHDVGKSQMPLAVWEKVAIVLGHRFASQTTMAWGNEQLVTWWRRPFINANQHPAWGAEMISKAGATPLVVELVRRHADKVQVDNPLYELLTVLQAADNRN